MADSESERGSDVGSDDDGEPGFDPADMEKMSDKEKKKWEKNLEKWRIFMDFLFRHIAIATFKYNCFEKDEMMQFMIALEKAESLRSQAKLKKGEEPKIGSYKTMKDAVELLQNQRYLNEANRIKRFLDIAGRMRGIGTIAGGFYKALKKGKVKGIDKVKHYLDFWKGFTVRSFDYSELQFKNANPDTFNELEKKYLVWPTVVRTSLNLAQRYLKKASESTGLALRSTDQVTMQKHMQAAEFVVAAKIEENLFQRVVQETKSFLSNPLITGQRNDAKSQNDNQSKWDLPTLTDIDPQMLRPIPDTAGDREPSASGKLLAGVGINLPSTEEINPNKKPLTPKWELPKLTDIDPALMQAIPDSGILLELPADPPKEKKKGKKGKKGSKKGRSTSASSHKGGKKKKKKK